MQIWIDVEDASGNRYGDGPITTAMDWESSDRMDGAGTFSFRMPASDPRSSLLQNKRYVRCWSALNGEIREEGWGIVDRIVVRPAADGATILEVAGDDVMRELSNRTVGELELYYDRVQAPDQINHVYNTNPISRDIITLPATVNLQPDPLSWLYIRSFQTFTKISFVLGSPKNTVHAVIKAQYLNRDPQGGDGWVNLPLTDGTATGSGDTHKTLAQSGEMTFDLPAGWQPDNGYYQVRLYCDDADVGPVRINSITVTRREPSTTPLAQLMAIAPPGWQLDPTGFLEIQNANGVYLQYAGESWLAALLRVAEQTGEHFRRAAAGRRITWLGNDTQMQSSGLYATPGIDADAAAGFGFRIVDLSETADTYDMATRLYPYGGGTGAERITLASTNRSAPAGWTLSTSGNYLEATNAVATYGRIDRRVDWTDIVANDITPMAAVFASNTLFDRAYEMLRRQCQIQRAYSLTVAPAQYDLFPGQTLRVDYDEWRESYHSVDIHAELWVLERTRRIDQNGAKTVALVVSSIDRWPNNDWRTTASAIVAAETGRAQTTAIQHLTDTDAGIPYYIAVENGLVTKVLKEERPGDYFGAPHVVRVRNGVLIGIA